MIYDRKDIGLDRKYSEIESFYFNLKWIWT
jgi:hypothetical protein